MLNESLDYKVNDTAMKMLSEMKQPIQEGSSEDIKITIQNAALDRAIDALYMQNKILDSIETLNSKNCFVTDRDGAVKLLRSFTIGYPES